MKKIFLSLVLCMTCVSDVCGRYDLTEFYLKNGLRVICMQKKTAPIVSFSIWYNCGAMHDAHSRSRVAHYLEHMAFCSNKGVFDDFLEQIGALRNAFTSLRTICFYEITSSRQQHIETVFMHEANRMEFFDVDHDKFLSEKGAILEERSMRCDDRPEGQYNEAFSANLFNRQAGGIPIIGWRNEIEAIEPRDLSDFHEKWFAPNNATVIVIGDIDVEYIRSLAEKYFGGIKSKTLPTEIKKQEKPTLVKHINFNSTEIASASVDYVYFVPFSPATNFRKTLGLDLAIKIMNQPDFFARKALEHSLNNASSVSFEYVHGYFQYDIVIASISCSLINNLADSEKVWRYFSDKLKNIDILESDLNAVKRQELIAIAYKKDDIKEIAEYIGWMLTFGYSLEQIQSVDETIQSITVGECQEALKSVFCSDPVSVSRMMPKGYGRE